MATTISFLHDGNKFARANFTHGENLGKAEDFAQRIFPYSLAKVDYVAITQGKKLDLGSIQIGAYGNIGLYAAVKLRCKSNSRLYEVRIFAPKRTMFDTEQEVLPDVGEDIADDYSALAGEEFTFEHGALCGNTV